MSSDERLGADERSRSTACRFVAAAVALAAVWAPYYLVPESWIQIHGTLPAGGGTASVGLGGEMVEGLVGLLFVPLLPRVSYRRRDWLSIGFVPIYGWVVAWRVGWRLALLPYRDWRPRPDEP